MEFCYTAGPDGEVSIYPRCEEHKYYFNGRPPLTVGCKDCWSVYWFMNIALTPNDKKQEASEMIVEAMSHLSEEVEAGTWDFEPYDHAVFEYEKDAWPDKNKEN